MSTSKSSSSDPFSYLYSTISISNVSIILDVRVYRLCFLLSFLYTFTFVFLLFLLLFLTLLFEVLLLLYLHFVTFQYKEYVLIP